MIAHAQIVDAACTGHRPHPRSTLLDTFTQNSIANFCASCRNDPEWPCEVLSDVIAINDVKEETDLDLEGLLNHDFALLRLSADIAGETFSIRPSHSTDPMLSLPWCSMAPKEIRIW